MRLALAAIAPIPIEPRHVFHGMSVCNIVCTNATPMRLAVGEGAPAAPGGRLDFISGKMVAETARDVLVKQDAGHAAAHRR